MKIVHIVGTGTIGLPLIGLLNRYKKEFGIDEVTFHKNTPLETDISGVKQLIAAGAILSTDADKFNEFSVLGATPMYTREEAIKRASVIVDCTPKGFGIENKEKYYNEFKNTSKGFVAQGSESGFGKPFAFNINNDALNNDDQFIQVVSCNTHNICSLIKTFQDHVLEGRFVCLRRASDISQNDDSVSGIVVDKHKDSYFGTHHAKDATRVLKTLRAYMPPTLYSSSCVLPTQYMHAIHFSLRLDSDNGDPCRAYRDIRDVRTQLRLNKMVAVTDRMTSNSVFSFGRDYGHYGRILNQTVVCLPTLQLRQVNDKVAELNGFCFTPQDGNSILSSVAATLWFLYKDWEQVDERMICLSKFLFKEI